LLQLEEIEEINFKLRKNNKESSEEIFYKEQIANLEG
jgi:hypothetical protein